MKAALIFLEKDECLAIHPNAHEIEIPEGVEWFGYQLHDDNGFGINQYRRIPIPRKKKVKKSGWIWTPTALSRKPYDDSNWVQVEWEEEEE